MLTEQQIYGVYVPVVTPFNAAGEVDLDSYQRYVKNIINNSIQGLVVNGTTGESPTVTVNEMQLLVNTSRELLQSTSIPLVVGTGTNDTASTVARTEIAANLGADCALVVVPYYSRPSQEGIIAHFRKAAEVGIPIMAYDIPSRTGTAMTVDTARTILEMNNVVGLKDCSGSTKMVTELVRTGAKPVLGGDDSLFYEMLSCGAAGGCSLLPTFSRQNAFVSLKPLHLVKWTSLKKALNNYCRSSAYCSRNRIPLQLNGCLAKTAYCPRIRFASL